MSRLAPCARQLLQAVHRSQTTSMLAPLAASWSTCSTRRDLHTLRPSRTFQPLVQSPLVQLVRHSSGHDPLNLKIIEQRAMLVLNLYDKIDNAKLGLDAHFMKDLGLDSLDHVEVIMAIEDEFGFEIPDDNAEKLITPRKICQYVADHEDIFE